jgi:hypothetical protein
VAALGSLQAQGIVSGFVAINNDRFELNSVAAALVPDSFDKSKTKIRTRLLLTDKPVPEDIIDDQGQIWDLKTEGVHGLEIEFSEDRAYYSLVVISGTIRSSISISGTFDGKKLAILTRRRVAGALRSKPAKIGDVMISYDVKFDTSIEPLDPVPLAADATSAKDKESVKAYLARIDAIRAGDKQRILELSLPERRAAIDTTDFPTVLQMMQSITPTRIDILKATENGDRAKLIVVATRDGKSLNAKVYLRRVDGKWFVIAESWSLD